MGLQGQGKAFQRLVLLPSSNQLDVHGPSAVGGGLGSSAAARIRAVPLSFPGDSQPSRRSADRRSHPPPLRWVQNLSEEVAQSPLTFDV